MTRTRHLTALAAVPLLLLAGCGENAATVRVTTVADGRATVMIAEPDGRKVTRQVDRLREFDFVGDPDAVAVSVTGARMQVGCRITVDGEVVVEATDMTRVVCATP